MSEATAFKHHVNKSSVRQLAEHLSPHLELDVARFVDDAVRGIEARELKDRINHIADALAAHLPPFPRAAEGIQRANAAAPEDAGSLWVYWPLCSYVERHGTAHFDAAFEVMHGLTRLASCEFAVRPFLAGEPERAFEVLARWVHDPSWHVRRLVSEGSRPLLPWGMRLKALQRDPSPSRPLLDALFDDPSEDVRRSVANHVNDISKDHPDLAVQIARGWKARASEHTAGVVRHAMRTLVKRGHAEALALQGFGPAQVREARLAVGPDPLPFGDSLTLRLELVADAPGAWMIDYAVHHMKADGTSKPKVFKWTRREVKAGETLQLEKRHAIRPISTRRYYDGQHGCDVRVNGMVVAQAAFVLRGVAG